MLRLRPKSQLKWEEVKAGYLFILPAILGILIFAIFPGLYGLSLSFYEYSFLEVEATWVGLDNFQAIPQDDLFFTALKNSLVYAIIVVVLHLVGGLGLALLIKQRVAGMGFFRSAYFLPVVVSMVVVSTVWKLIYNTNNGLLNSVLLTIGLPAQPFLTSTTHALPSLALMAFWKEVGFTMLIYLGALQAIPRDLYESAEIDGAGRWQSFWYITVPLLRRVILFVLVVTTISAIKVFTPVYVMTDGGPLNSTTVLIFHIFRNAFRYFNMGYAAAMSSILFLIILTITWIQFRLLRSEVEQ